MVMARKVELLKDLSEELIADGVITHDDLKRAISDQKTGETLGYRFRGIQKKDS